jgi:hypothetical protein
MKKDIVSALLGAMLSLVVFGLFYFFLDQKLIDKFLPRNRTEAIVYFPMLIMAPVIAILVHELGHLLTGLYLGQRLKLFVVAFLGIKEEEGKIKIFFNKNPSYFGGIAATAPRHESEITPLSFAKILIAGPIFSLLFFVISALIFLKTDSLFNSFFGLSSLLSFGLFLATTIPEKTGIMFTDRKRFHRLIKKGTTQEVEIALYELISKGIIDNSFKNIDIHKTNILAKDNDITIIFWAHYLRYMFYKENNSTDQECKAIEELQKLKHEIPTSIWNSLKIE